MIKECFNRNDQFDSSLFFSSGIFFVFPWACFCPSAFRQIVSEQETFFIAVLSQLVMVASHKEAQGHQYQCKDPKVFQSMAYLGAKKPVGKKDSQQRGSRKQVETRGMGPCHYRLHTL